MVKQGFRNLINTIGHSTLSIESFIEILKAYQIGEIVDVRTIPRSRHNPQFNEDALPQSLKTVGISYVHIPDLGGLRRARPDSINTAWRNPSFRGFADYMQTNEFKAGLENLIESSKKECLAIMCAEAVPWRCHRSLIGDALLIRKIQPVDIFSKTSSKLHTLTPFARVSGKVITYPTPVQAK